MANEISKIQIGENQYEIVDEYAREKLNSLGSDGTNPLVPIAEGTIDEFVGGRGYTVTLAEIPEGSDGVYEVMLSTHSNTGFNYSVYAKGRMNDEREFQGTNLIMDGIDLPLYLQIEGALRGVGGTNIERQCISFSAFKLTETFNGTQGVTLNNIKYAVYKLV